jgi:hypothetical protein
MGKNDSDVKTGRHKKSCRVREVGKVTDTFQVAHITLEKGDAQGEPPEPAVLGATSPTRE